LFQFSASLCEKDGVLSVAYKTLLHLFSTVNYVLFLQFSWQLDQYAKIVANIGRGYFSKNKVFGFIATL
jgi:hypothetical protein